MEKIAGIALLMGGIIGYLHSWISRQKTRQRRMDEFLVFLQKTIFAIEAEKVRIIEYFLSYHGEDAVISDTLHEIAHRLNQNIYPIGKMVWEEVLLEKKKDWDFDEEAFEVILKAGEGFFGRSRNENLCFLQKNLTELERHNHKTQEKHAQERKVWVPVGMLGGIMLMIIFI